MSKLTIYDMKGQAVGEVALAEDLLVTGKGEQAVHDAVVAHMAGMRAGTASTLGKGAVAGSNRKPWRQKGTGRARAGCRRSPVWRGGGVAHGPHPRSFAKKLPRKVAKLAFRRAFSDKAAAGDVKVLESLTLPGLEEKRKTHAFVDLLAAFGAGRGALVIVDKIDILLTLASRNVPGVEVATAGDVSTYQILKHRIIVVTKSAMDGIRSRLEGKAA